MTDLGDEQYDDLDAEFAPIEPRDAATTLLVRCEPVDRVARLTGLAVDDVTALAEDGRVAHATLDELTRRAFAGMDRMGDESALLAVVGTLVALRASLLAQGMNR